LNAIFSVDGNMNFSPIGLLLVPLYCRRLIDGLRWRGGPRNDLVAVTAPK